MPSRIASAGLGCPNPFVFNLSGVPESKRLVRHRGWGQLSNRRTNVACSVRGVARSHITITCFLEGSKEYAMLLCPAYEVGRPEPRFAEAPSEVWPGHSLASRVVVCGKGLVRRVALPAVQRLQQRFCSVFARSPSCRHPWHPILKSD